MTEIAVNQPRELVLPGTGELVNLDDAGQVARALSSLRDWKRHADEARAVLEAALVAESARQGTKTLHLGAMTASVSADTELAWDVTVLIGLLAAGLPSERYTDLVTETVSYKINASVAKQIAGANPAYAAIIDAAQSRVPKRQYVRVEGA